MGPLLSRPNHFPLDWLTLEFKIGILTWHFVWDVNSHRDWKTWTIWADLFQKGKSQGKRQFQPVSGKDSEIFFFLKSGKIRGKLKKKKKKSGKGEKILVRKVWILCKVICWIEIWISPLPVVELNPQHFALNHRRWQGPVSYTPCDNCKYPRIMRTHI